MAGQVWGIPEEGGFQYSDQLSNVLRTNVQPLTKVRQLCDVKDAMGKGLSSGDLFHWNVYSDIGKQGGTLVETQTMPQSSYKIVQGTLTVTEFGNSVPYTGKLNDLSLHPVTEIINRTLKHDAVKSFDFYSDAEFRKTPLRVGPTGGTASDSIELSETGTAVSTNSAALSKEHVKAIVDTAKMRNMPPYQMDDYFALSHPTTWRPFKNELEEIHKHTPQGLGFILNGEIGRYESVRFIEQTHIPVGGAADSPTWAAGVDPIDKVADPWDNGLSSWAYFFGEDTVAECIVIPEEIRAKITTDYGRSRGIAYYALLGYGLTHTLAMGAKQARILLWDSLS